MKAPTGGITSAVNGQFYEGGQFTPEHGMFCGRAGAKRKVRVEKAATVGRLFGDSTAARLYTVERSGSFPYAATVFANTRQEAIAVLASAGVAGPFTATEI